LETKAISSSRRWKTTKVIVNWRSFQALQVGICATSHFMTMHNFDALPRYYWHGRCEVTK
jgi:hypothetical protein